MGNAFFEDNVRNMSIPALPEQWLNGPHGAVVMSSVNGLGATGFASRYRLQPRAGS